MVNIKAKALKNSVMLEHGFVTFKPTWLDGLRFVPATLSALRKSQIDAMARIAREMFGQTRGDVIPNTHEGETQERSGHDVAWH